MPSEYVITYGTLDNDRVCELCAEFRIRFGTLIDPNGHKWIICADCINSLWADKQQMNQLEREREREAATLDRVFAKLRDQLLEGE